SADHEIVHVTEEVLLILIGRRTFDVAVGIDDLAELGASEKRVDDAIFLRRRDLRAASQTLAEGETRRSRLLQRMRLERLIVPSGKKVIRAVGDRDRLPANL